MPVATLSLGWDMLGAPESLPACLESGPHRLLDAPYTFVQRHPLPADLLVEGSLILPSGWLVPDTAGAFI